MANKEKKQVKNSKDKTSFFKSFKAELKKVVWPTPKQLFNSTAAVLVIVVIIALMVFILDFAFESMNKYGIDKIKEAVSNSTTVDENTTSEETENTSTENTTSDENSTNETSSEETQDNVESTETSTTENTENSNAQE